MMGLVAAVVAVVILIFFGLGYLFGRGIVRRDRIAPARVQAPAAAIRGLTKGVETAWF